MKDLKNGAQFVLETKEELNDLIMKFLDSPEEGDDCIAVFFELPGLTKPEIIINPRANVDEKLAYYNRVYNENLELPANNNVKITGISFV